MKNNKSNQASIKLAVVERDPLRLAGFHALLEGYPEIRVESLSLSELSQLQQPIDVLVLGGRNIQNVSAMIEHLKTIRPGLRIIVTGPNATEKCILDALASGAKAYIDESAPASEFIRAIHGVNEGLIWASRRLLATLIEHSTVAHRKISGRGDFTTRERQVLEMLVTGRSNKEIAAPLGIEERTVKAHVAKLMRKVGVQNRIMLSVHAVNRHLVAQP